MSKTDEIELNLRESNYKLDKPNDYVIVCDKCGGVVYGNLNDHWPRWTARIHRYRLKGKLPYARIWLGRCGRC